MEAVLKRLIEHGFTITPVEKPRNSVIVGKAGRDVICFLETRTREMQRFADTWSGAPPVDLLKPSFVDALNDAILAGEYDADSRFEREQIILRLRHT